MKILKRDVSLLYDVIAKDRIRVELSNGERFDITECKATGHMIINKIDENISVYPRYANQIEIS